VRVGEARAAASEWVRQQVAQDADFRGAYFSGSTVGLPDDAELPSASDVDVVLVTELAEPPAKPGKFVYHGTLVEATYIPRSHLASADDVLTSYFLASSFRVDTIIADPTGNLRALQAQVSRQFAEPAWVRRRCENVRQRIEDGLRGIDASAPLHEQVTAWLFATSATTLVPLLAALRNPTVRLRYLAAYEVLADYGHSDVYPDLLELLGCVHLTPRQVEHHIDELARTFDAAAAVTRTPFFFRTDISAAARPIAIDGSRALCAAGRHREAVFWIVATFSRCHAILAADGPPDLKRELEAAFHAVLSDIGITSTNDFPPRRDAVTRFLPTLCDTAEAIMSAHR